MRIEINTFPPPRPTSSMEWTYIVYWQVVIRKSLLTIGTKSIFPYIYLHYIKGKS